VLGRLYSPSCEPVSELWSFTCHMVSHSVTHLLTHSWTYPP